MARKVLYKCDVCGLGMDEEFAAHVEAYVIGGECYDEPRTDLCPRCWDIGKEAMVEAFEEKK